VNKHQQAALFALLAGGIAAVAKAKLESDLVQSIEEETGLPAPVAAAFAGLLVGYLQSMS
jgi:hypothetical protein